MKNKIKIFIALGISLITTLIFMVNTYAYQTNQYSYTLTYDSSTSSLIYYNFNTIDTTSNINEYYLMVNVTPKAPYNNSMQVYAYSFNDSYVQGSNIITSISVRNAQTTPIQTFVIKTNGNGSLTSSQTKIGLHLGNYTYEDIINIDFVKSTDIYLGQYVSTYISNLENQVDTLTNQYNELSENYEELENNYETLNDNYEQLEQNYETLNNESFGANGFYNNVRSITYFDIGLTSFDLNTNNAYKYLSNATLNLEELLTANGIKQSQARQTRRQCLEIILDKPINLSNFIYYLQFNGDPTGTPPEDYYIAFFNDNPNITGSSDNAIFYFEDTEYIQNVGYKLELKGSMFINEIDIYWENLETDRAWPYRMTSSEYNIGLEDGKNQGYKTGYNNGINQGIEQGIEQGIQQADSRINRRIAPHI